MANLHFTISEIHKDTFDEEFKRIEKIVESKTKTTFNISFSYQCQSTDTVAVHTDNSIFRNEQGEILFRPSGHGALIKNLNALEADIIFIKNIDNIVVFKYENHVCEYKKMLAGILLDIQAQSFEFLEELERNDISEERLISIANFLTQKLNVVISLEFEKYSRNYQIEYLSNEQVLA